MRLLIVDTVVAPQRVLLANSGRVAGRDLAPGEQLVALPVAVEALLQEAQLTPDRIEAIGCCVGPGSYNAVRAGVAFVKGFGAVLGTPIVPFTGFDLVARAVGLEGEVALPAGRTGWWIGRAGARAGAGQAEAVRWTEEPGPEVGRLPATVGLDEARVALVEQGLRAGRVVTAEALEPLYGKPPSITPPRARQGRPAV